MAHQQVDELPGIDEYAQELQDSSPRMVHRVCEMCVPEPHPGDTAVCGYVIKGRPSRKGDYPCLKCARVWRQHVLSHFGGRGA